MSGARSAVTVVVPGDLQTRTGGYGYDRRMIDGLTSRGWLVDVLRLDDSFPFPTDAAREHAERALGAIVDGRTVLVDGLALGALPDEAARHARRLDLVALVHHPLACETGLTREAARALEESERRALASVRRVIVTSRATAAALRSYGVGPERITVVEPGTDQAPLARGSGRRLGDSESAVALLCVASVTPRKGHETLIRALASIRSRPWRLTCAGSLDRDPATGPRVLATARELGVDDRIAWVGDLAPTELAIEYDRADLFVLATLYEGYGMAVAEALARGLPVIGTATGAIPDLLEASGEGASAAGIVVAPGDVDGLRDALDATIGDADLRARLADAARSVRARLPTWEAAAGALARTLRCSDG